MRLLLVLSFIWCLTPLTTIAQTSVVETTIHELDMGEKMDEEILVYLGTGNVVSLNPAETHLINDLYEAKQNRLEVSIELNSKKEIVGLNFLPHTHVEAEIPTFQKNFEDYIPTVITSMDEAKILFKESKKNANKESQCYNRAHVWSYEWRVKRNIYTSKVWVYFTRKFIRKFKPAGFEWWFHVAPMTHVNINGVVKERVMDIKYQNGPSRIQQWTDFFTRGTRATCPVVTNYTDYANHPDSDWCFIMKSSMYYYQPVDLEFLEKYGTPKNMWNELEVRQAYLDAFSLTPIIQGL